MTEEIRRTLETLAVPHPLTGERLFELRTVGKPVLSGYFRCPEKAAAAAAKHPRETFYVTLNPPSSGCHSRAQSERLTASPKETTSDRDIDGRAWLLVDIDPKRPAGVSATDAEKEAAGRVARRAMEWLAARGVSGPIVADSGNGWHLLYRINAANGKAEHGAVKAFLQVLAMRFDTAEAGVDTAVHNAARITKLYGTRAAKGADTPERPHRNSRLLKVPEGGPQITPFAVVESIAALLPREREPRGKDGGGEFDLEAFIARHGIAVAKTAEWSGGAKYVLEACPFNPAHKAPDSAIIRLPTGAIAFNCFHNSCSHYTWRHLRELHEPGCYDARDAPPRAASPQPRPPEPAGKPPTRPAFLRMADVRRHDRAQIVSIPTGYAGLDRRIIGLNKGEMTVWSGGNGSGKSTAISQIALEAVNAGFRALLFSGEMTAERLKNWLHLQAAGRAHALATEHPRVFRVARAAADKIDAWLADRLWLYNNEHGHGAAAVADALARQAEAALADLVVVDNLMALELEGGERQLFEAQSRFTKRLSALAKDANAHVVFVCHPRKAAGFLRKDDISGSSDITNIADNVFMSHRVNKDFRDRAKGFFDAGEAEKYHGYDNVVEVMKNRDLGVLDELAGLYYCVRSKRFLNSRDENKRYGWDDYGPEDTENAGLPF